MWCIGRSHRLGEGRHRRCSVFQSGDVTRLETATRERFRAGSGPAARIAADKMFGALVESKRLSRETHILLCSAAMDMMVTEVVDEPRAFTH